MLRCLNEQRIDSRKTNQDTQSVYRIHGIGGDGVGDYHYL